MITDVECTNGTVYLHTHKGEDSGEIAEALRPYIGHLASFYPPNNYGHINPHKATYGYIRAINGDTVTVYVPALDYTGDVNAFDAFGSYCTHVYPKKEGE